MNQDIDNFQSPIMTQQQWDAWADRIDAVLRERKKIGAERRMREREYQGRNADSALSRARSLSQIRQFSPDFHQTSDHQMTELSLAFEALISSNAAYEALK